MLSRHLARIIHRGLLLCMILLGSMQVSCVGPSTEELPFTTLARDAEFSFSRVPEGHPLYSGDFLVLTRAAEVEQPSMDIPGVQPQLSARLMTQLRAVDYEHNFVVIVFRRVGEVSSENTTIIQEIIRAGEEVVLQVRYGSPPPGRPGGAADSYPNHVAVVSKVGQWGHDIRFTLQVDGKEVKEHTYFIP